MFHHVMMMIASNSRARTGGKERGEVKGECGGMMMMIASNSRARMGGKERGEVKGEYGIIQGGRRGMLTTGEWYNPMESSVMQADPGNSCDLG